MTAAAARPWLRFTCSPILQVPVAAVPWGSTCLLLRVVCRLAIRPRPSYSGHRGPHRNQWAASAFSRWKLPISPRTGSALQNPERRLSHLPASSSFYASHPLSHPTPDRQAVPQQPSSDQHGPSLTGRRLDRRRCVNRRLLQRARAVTDSLSRRSQARASYLSTTCTDPPR
jgi:hypothetical protein